MEFKNFSAKQIVVLNWWSPKSKYRHFDAIICDGAVRSGKTMCMSLSFILWAFFRFEGQNFAICSRTIGSLRRNVITPLIPALEGLGFSCKEKISQNYLEIIMGNRKNRFYLFGGKDENSASLIQGMTLAGILLDEAALMPRSFVEQALARCSVEGSRFWFNCNPEHPFHWFYREWIEKAEEKNALYLHFVMKDNPSLSDEMIGRYEKLYSGVFYQRFVLGKWVKASGLVYPMFSEEEHIYIKKKPYTRYYISCDYGTVNPTSMGLWGEYEGKWYRTQEYYHDSRKSQRLLTDAEYYKKLEELAGDRKIEAVIVDPSAASFMECIRRNGKFRVIPAKNNVIDGIRIVSDYLKNGKLLFHKSCRDCIREFSLYVWEEGREKDAPKKENDHAMDDVRYFVNTVLTENTDDFFVLSVERTV